MRKTLFLLAVLVIAAAIVVSGIVPRLRARQTLREDTTRSAPPAVTVIKPTAGAPSHEVVLPGNVQAYVDAPIYARTSGYLKRWYFDIGAKVKRGQLLAEIESPEVDQQLTQAREDLKSTQADLRLAQITANRYTDLFKSDSVARQEVDNAVQNASARESLVKASQANVGRIQQLVAFEKIYAPFDGVVTARNTDTGQLIQSGSSQIRELFHVASIERLRVFVNVPQVYSHELRPGLVADLTMPEMPGRRFPASLVRASDSFDPATRTLLVELDLPNREHQIFPGAFSEVHFRIKSASPALVIPSTSLIFRSQGLRVPVVRDGKAVLLPVTTGKDFGNTVEILTGLPSDAAIIANPPDSIVDGEQVRIVSPKTQPQAED